MLLESLDLKLHLVDQYLLLFAYHLALLEALRQLSQLSSHLADLHVWLPVGLLAELPLQLGILHPLSYQLILSFFRRPLVLCRLLQSPLQLHLVLVLQSLVRIAA